MASTFILPGDYEIETRLARRVGLDEIESAFGVHVGGEWAGTPDDWRSANEASISENRGTVASLHSSQTGYRFIVETALPYRRTVVWLLEQERPD